MATSWNFTIITKTEQNQGLAYVYIFEIKV